MNNVILHTEYLLRHHDCVVLPGWGAFISRRLPARFDAENPDVMLPPCRRLTFNAELTETDGLVAASISRRDGISYAEADRVVATELGAVMSQLEHDGELLFGHLGAFMKLPGTPVRFYPSVRTVNSQYQGLGPLKLRALSRRTADYAGGAVLPPVPVTPRQTAEPAATTDAGHDVPVRRKWMRNIGAAAALLAIVITVAVFVMNPIRMANEPEQASIAPVVERTVVVDTHTGITPVTDTVVAETAAADVTVGNAVPGTATRPEAVSAATQADVAAAQSAVSTPSVSAVNTASTEPAAPQKRFDNSDPYVVVVASFPTAAQARQYMLDHSGRRLDILEQDGKYRVYCSTASSYADARRLTASAGVSDAWVCRR